MPISTSIQSSLAKMTQMFQGTDKENDTIIQGISSVDEKYPTDRGTLNGPIMETSIELDNIFARALFLGASDIHIEPEENSLLIRIRVDGRFTLYGRFSHQEKAPLIAKIKILSGLKIDEQRLPQDGKAVYHDPESGKDVDLRVSIIPTIYGEKVVVRLLRKESELMDLRSIGVLPMNMITLKKHLENQFGLVLIVGPTGSGKSTTLYSMLSRFDPEEKNISTLEDPVEYRIK